MSCVAVCGARSYVGLDWGDRVSQRHVLPLFLFLVFVLAVRSLIWSATQLLPLTRDGRGLQVLLLTSLCTCARKTCLRLVSCITCGNVGSEHDGDEFRENYKLPTYDQAVEDHLMQGIPTYNILQNPLCAWASARMLGGRRMWTPDPVPLTHSPRVCILRVCV